MRKAEEGALAKAAWASACRRDVFSWILDDLTSPVRSTLGPAEGGNAEYSLLLAPNKMRGTAGSPGMVEHSMADVEAATEAEGGRGARTRWHWAATPAFCTGTEAWP